MEYFLWPLKVRSSPTQYFGEHWSKNKQKYHTGIDIIAAVGEEVLAVSDGIIVKVDTFKDGWGGYVIINHDVINYCTAYLHIVTDIKDGTRIVKGTAIGKIADLGGKARPHLHFNVWKGPYKNIVCRGALPTLEYAGKINPVDDPAFPDSFVDPMHHFQPNNNEFNSLFDEDSRDLYEGLSGHDVRFLQILLNKDPATQVAPDGVGSLGQESSYFGRLTRAAVQRFQRKHGIILSEDDPGYGYVGPKTRKTLRELFSQ